MKFSQWVLLGMLFAFGAGCASSYSKKDGLTGTGYEETKISDNVYSVTFQGNGVTAIEDTKKYLFRRSAEVALENGYQYFAIQDSKDGFMNSMYPFNNHTIVLYKEGQQPKLSFKAESVIANTNPNKK